MSELLLIPLEDSVVFPNMSVTLTVEVGECCPRTDGRAYGGGAQMVELDTHADRRLPLVRQQDLGLRHPARLPFLRQAAGVAVALGRDGDDLPGLQALAPHPRRCGLEGTARLLRRVPIRLFVPGLLS